MNPSLNARQQLRNGWWILIFFAVLASMLVPLLIITGRQGPLVSVGAQAVFVAIAASVCQYLRRRSVTELTGRFDRHWGAQVLAGCLSGAALMLLPAAALKQPA